MVDTGEGKNNRDLVVRESIVRAWVTIVKASPKVRVDRQDSPFHL